jgi:hypothetical protein
VRFERQLGEHVPATKIRLKRRHPASVLRQAALPRTDAARHPDPGDSMSSGDALKLPIQRLQRLVLVVLKARPNCSIKRDDLVAEVLRQLCVGAMRGTPRANFRRNVNQAVGVLKRTRNALLRKDEEPILHFGCESQTFDYWRENLQELCEEHERRRAWTYERKIHSLLNFLDTTLERAA